MKKTTKVILGSAMTMALCASLIAGSTLALFSSESKTNIAITSGKVNVTATIGEDSLKTYSYQDDGTGEFVSTATATPGIFETGGTATITGGELKLVNMASGDKVEFDINITNESTIAVKYQFQVTTSGDEKLYKALDVTFGGTKLVDSAFVAGTGRSVWTEWDTGEAKGKTVQVTVELPYDYDDKIMNGNEEETVQGKTCGLTFAVIAVQGNAKTENPTDGSLEIHTINEFVAFAKSSATESYEGKTITLKTDIDFNEIAKLSTVAQTGRSVSRLAETISNDWTPIGSADAPFKGTFEGEGHTIRNFKLEAAEGNAGLFGCVDGATIQNLKIEDATVTATDGAAGVLAAQVQGDGLTVSGVAITGATVSGNSTAEGADITVQAGLVGSIAEGAAAPTVSNTTIDTESSDAAGVDSETKWGSAEEGKPETYYAVADADQLAALAKDVNDGVSFEGKIVKLTADIDLTGRAWTPIGTSENPFIGTFMGNDHKITGLTVKGESYLGLFGQLGTGEKSDITKTHINDDKTHLTLENVTIEGTGDFAGALAGYAAASVKNVTVTGTVKITGNLDVGGVIGAGFGGSSYSDIFADICVQSENEASLIQGNDRVGGVLGYLKSNINVKSNSVGGTDPTLTYASKEVVANNVTVKAPLTYGAETFAHVGGVVGVAKTFSYSQYIKISKANSTATVRNGSKFPYTGIGGIVGAIASVTDTKLEEKYKGIALNDCSFTGKLYRYSESGLTKDFMLFHAGLVGSSYMVPITDPMGTSAIGSTTMELRSGVRSGGFESVYAENAVSFNYYPTDAAHENGDENTYIHVENAGTSSSSKVEYTLDTREAFLMFANSVTSRTGKITYGSQTMDLTNHDSIVGQVGKDGNAAGMYKGTVVKLGKDITMNEDDVIAPIGQPVESTFNSNSNTVVGFLGSFDGAEHSITNLHISETKSNYYVGLFTLLGNKSTQTISKLTLTNVKVTAASGNTNVGVVVGKGYNYCNLQNITVTTAEGTPSKLCGVKQSAKISGCTINGTEVTE